MRSIILPEDLEGVPEHRCQDFARACVHNLHCKGLEHISTLNLDFGLVDGTAQSAIAQSQWWPGELSKLDITYSCRGQH